MTTFKSTTIISLLLILGTAFSSPAQQKWYFVDGFHGGVYGHFPLDTYTDYMSSILEARPEWSMCLEIEPETWDSIAVRVPASLEQFKKWASTPRVEFTNPAYAQPYMYNISGESIIRQFTYGMEKIRTHFPDAEFLTYAVEEPCFTSSLPTVLSQLGFKYASIKCPNTCWGGYSAGFGNGNVDWTGPDGSVILAAPRYECEELGDKVWETKANGGYKSYYLDSEKAGIARPVGMCYQDAGWRLGPWLDQYKWLKGTDNLGGNIKYVTWREYFENEPAGTSHEVYRMPQEDVRPGLVWGSQVLQKLSQQVRSAENKLVQTEKTAAMLRLLTGKSPDQTLIDEAWRTLLLSQHHDCWIVPYNRLNKRGTWADNVALWTEASEKNCEDVLAAMTSPSVSGGSIEYGVVNTAAFARNETVRADLPSGWPEDFRITDVSGRDVPYFIDGGKVVFKASAPALGIASYTFSKEGKSTRVIPSVKTYSKGSGPVKVTAGNYTLTLSPDEGGVITSIISKNGKEYVDRSSGQALNLLSGWFYEENRWHLSSEEPATVEVTSANGIATKITVRGTIASTPFTQTIFIEDGSRRIGFDLNIEWKKDVGIGKFAQKRAYDNRQRAFYDSRYDLNVLFPVACKSPSLFKDAPFDVCESELEDTYFDRWDGIKHNVILNWVDLCGKDGRSMALLSDHTTSYTYGSDFPLALTVQFSGNGLWGRNYVITGPTFMRYAIVPHQGKWDEAGIQEESQAWNEPLAVVPGVSSQPGLLDLDGTGYVVSSLCAEDGGYLLRLYNASGDNGTRKIKLGIPSSDILEVNLIGEVTGHPVYKKGAEGTTLEVSIPRYGIKTFKIN